MKNPGIKIPYLSIEKPLPEGTRCIEVRIPDDDAFVPVLGGLVAIATKWFNYDRDPTHKGVQLATLWRMAYLATKWEGCMNCEELTECLTPLLADFAQSIVQQITNNSEYGVENPGQPLTEEQNEQNLTGETNLTCDLDITWAQSLAVIQFTNRLITDLFEQIESKTNVVELAQLFNSVPFVRYVTNAIGEEAAVDLIAYYQEAVTEGYLAEYTEALEQELACAVFCIAKLDCTISVDLLDYVFSSRVASIVPDTPGDLIELLALLAGISLSAADVVNLMFWFAWKGFKLAQFFITDAVGGTFDIQTLLALAVNDANNDWELLCTDCPLVAQNMGIFDQCGEVMNFVEFEDGVPFDMEAYFNTAGTGSGYAILIKLPDGVDWQVTLNSITGTITPPVDLSETAYAWIDPTTGFQNVLWNAPADPSDFGTKDTTGGTFATWCSSAVWNAALFNQTPFTANFTVTAI